MGVNSAWRIFESPVPFPAKGNISNGKATMEPELPASRRDRSSGRETGCERSERETPDGDRMIPVDKTLQTDMDAPVPVERFSENAFEFQSPGNMATECENLSGATVMFPLAANNARLPSTRIRCFGLDKSRNVSPEMSHHDDALGIQVGEDH